MPGTSSRLESRARILVAALLGAVILGACGAGGATPVEGSKSPQQVVRDAAGAVRGVQSFHVSGTLTGGTLTLGIDLRVDNPDTISGTMTMDGATAQFIIVDGATYLSGESFFTKFAGTAAGQLIGNQWAKLPVASATSLESSLDGFVDTAKFADCLDGSIGTTKLTDATATYSGASVVAVTGGDTIVEVADSGTPYPLRVSVTGPTGLLEGASACSSTGAPSSTPAVVTTGTLNFDHWGSTFTITAPARFITAPATTPTPAATGVPTSFHYSDPQARWSATFAGPPVYTATTVQSPAGTIPYLYAEYASPGIDQLVGVYLLKRGTTYDLAKAIDGIATGFSGKMISQSLGNFRGDSSILGVVSTSIGFIKVRIVRTSTVVYIISTLGQTNPPSDFAGFIAGVRLTPH